jgi:hypothetical protein
MISEFLTHSSVQWLKLDRGFRENARRLLAAEGRVGLTISCQFECHI